MEINKSISIINSFGNKQSSKTEDSKRSKIIKSELKTDSGKDTLVQISDYLHLKTKPTTLVPENRTPISDEEQAQTVLEQTISQTLQQPSQAFLAQATSNSWDVFYLLD
jgi:hypothetical protein